MTPGTRGLLHTAKKTADYLERKITGGPSRGMYEDIGIARELVRAIEVFEQEQREAGVLVKKG